MECHPFFVRYFSLSVKTGIYKWLYLIPRRMLVCSDLPCSETNLTVFSQAGTMLTSTAQALSMISRVEKNFMCQGFSLPAEEK